MTQVCSRVSWSIDYRRMSCCISSFFYRVLVLSQADLFHFFRVQMRGRINTRRMHWFAFGGLQLISFCDSHLRSVAARNFCSGRLSKELKILYFSFNYKQHCGSNCFWEPRFGPCGGLGESRWCEETYRLFISINNLKPEIVRTSHERHKKKKKSFSPYSSMGWINRLFLFQILHSQWKNRKNSHKFRYIKNLEHFSTRRSVIF